MSFTQRPGVCGRASYTAECSDPIGPRAPIQPLAPAAGARPGSGLDAVAGWNPPAATTLEGMVDQSVRVTLAEAMGTCFGVQDAIDMALDPAFRGRLTVVGQLVHNPQTVQHLRENGIRIVEREEIDSIDTEAVMITGSTMKASVNQPAMRETFQSRKSTKAPRWEESPRAGFSGNRLTSFTPKHPGRAMAPPT